MAKEFFWLLLLAVCVTLSYSKPRNFMDPLVNCDDSEQSERLSKHERKVLKHLEKSGWTVVGDADSLKKKLVFMEFGDAFSFITKVALKAEAVCHHPYFESSFKQVEVTLFTWDKGGITMNDVKMAKFIDNAAALFISPIPEQIYSIED